MFASNLSPEQFENLLVKNDRMTYNQWAKGLDYATAWDICPYPEFLLHFAQPNAQDAIQICCHWARLVLHLVNSEESRPRLAIEAAEAFLRGNVDKGACTNAFNNAFAVKSDENNIMVNASRCAAFAAKQATASSNDFSSLRWVSKYGEQAYGEAMVDRNDHLIGPIAFEAAGQASVNSYKVSSEARPRYTDNGIAYDYRMEEADAAYDIKLSDCYSNYTWKYRVEMMKTQASILRLYIERPTLLV